MACACAAALSGNVAGCGGGDAGDEPARVVITKRGFEPALLEIEAGDRVVFVNRSKGWPQSAKDDSQGAIEVSPQPGPTRHDGSEVARASRRGFATHALFPGEAQTVIFPVVRRYRYYSAFARHLRGTIQVVKPD